MTSEQAWGLMKQLAENFRGTLAEHQQLQTALTVLKPKKDEPKAE
jgi:hypothetical protein